MPPEPGPKPWPESRDGASQKLLKAPPPSTARLQEVRSKLGQVIGRSVTQYTVLIAIAHLRATDEKVGVNLVADHLHFSGAFITIEINKLVAAGLVEKETDAEDRRRVVLAITPKARALL